MVILHDAMPTMMHGFIHYLSRQQELMLLVWAIIVIGVVCD
jgi:hypothetical protein